MEGILYPASIVEAEKGWRWNIRRLRLCVVGQNPTKETGSETRWAVDPFLPWGGN